MDAILRHIAASTVLSLADEVDYQPGQIVSKTLVQNSAVSLTLFAFDEGEEISTHQAGGDALVTVLDGTGQVTIDGTPHTLTAGQSIIMPAQVPHSVLALARFKMSLTVVSPAA
ncbi:MAG: cupin domain-containing protein [Propionibacteriaceae bacterium]|nr:cupin domain-containing protein [Propionibacteriaceae bacterium]